MTLRLDYTNMMAVGGRGRRLRRDVGRRSVAIRRGIRRRRPPARAGSPRLPRPAGRRGAPRRRPRLRRSRPRPLRRRRGARHRRLRARSDRTPHRAPATIVERAAGRGARRAAAPARARQRRSRARSPRCSRQVALPRTLFIVISKSGGTAETMAQYLVVRGRLRGRGSARARDHVVFVTDPENGALRALARARRDPGARHPAERGRTVQRPDARGLLPAALVGIDPARAARRRRRDARRAAATTRSSVTRPVSSRCCSGSPTPSSGKGTHVLMPYSDALRDMADWFVQLWAESLGKHDSEGTGIGPTPLAALGATDQHSQVQLFMEGHGEQDRDLRGGGRARRRRDHPGDRAGRDGALVPGQPLAVRAARHRATRHGRCAGPSRAART